MLAMFSADSPPEKRLSVALVASFVAHAILIATIGIAPPQGGMSSTLRVRIVPLSMPDLPQLDAAQSVEAPRELQASVDTAPRAPRQETNERSGTPTDTDKNANERIGLAAELPIYYRGDEVDVRATPRSIASTSRIERSLMLGRMVKVKLRLFISDAGDIDRFDIVEAEGMTPSISLDDLLEIPFHPAQRNGRPVRSQKLVELTFIP